MKPCHFLLALPIGNPPRLVNIHGLIMQRDAALEG